MPRKIQKTNPKKPEKVYKVVTKKPKILSKKTPLKKGSKKRFILHKKLSTRTSLFVLFCSIFLFIAVTYAGYWLSLRAINESDVASQQIGYTKDTARRMALIGTVANYPSEIENFQSAPVDLQEFALKDYRLLKSNCIVNGNFAGPLSYKIVNVVYDSFARIEKNCNGPDTLILVKMSGIWTVVFSGNDLPECDKVNAFDIPQGISYNCRYGYKVFTNPNP